MKNKICVYAIAKNEAHHVERWYNSMKEADCIVVLDTGSTDDTVEKLKALGVTVKQTSYEQFRFDVARNDSLELVPEDCNIRVCTDIDEVFDKGWAKILRDNWNEDIHRRCMYRNIYFESDGLAIDYDKIHGKNYIWKYPCHEWLYDKQFEELGGCYPIDTCLDLRGQITLRHFPDNHSRGFYLPLLMLRYKENPDSDITGKVYLAREFTFNQMWEECIQISTQALSLGTAVDENEFLLRQCLADSLYYTGRKEEAFEEFCKMMRLRPQSRNAYVRIAMYLLEESVNKPTVAKALLLEGLERTSFDNSWVEDGDLWTWKYYDWLSIACDKCGEYEEALKWSCVALEKEPDNEHLQSNFHLIKENFLREV